MILRLPAWRPICKGRATVTRKRETACNSRSETRFRLGDQLLERAVGRPQAPSIRALRLPEAPQNRTFLARRERTSLAKVRVPCGFVTRCQRGVAGDHRPSARVSFTGFVASPWPIAWRRDVAPWPRSGTCWPNAAAPQAVSRPHATVVASTVGHLRIDRSPPKGCIPSRLCACHSLRPLESGSIPREFFPQNQLAWMRACDQE